MKFVHSIMTKVSGDYGDFTISISQQGVRFSKKIKGKKYRLTQFVDFHSLEKGFLEQEKSLDAEGVRI